MRSSAISRRYVEPGALDRWWSKMVALQVADARCAHQGGFLGALDAFGNGGKTKAFNKFDQIAQNNPLLTARREVPNEGPIDFDGVHRQKLKMAQ